MKEYFKGTAEFLSGEGVIYTEFINETATRQINIIDNQYFASSSLHDKHEMTGFLLYDGKQSELDLSDSLKIQPVDFERQWSLALERSGSKNDIVYRFGDAAEPLVSPVMIVHIVNNRGKWGRGFVLSLSKKYPSCKKEYLKLYDSESKPGLGDVQILNVSSDDKVYVANMFAQDGIRKNYKDKKVYVSYEALKICLDKIADYCLVHRITSVQMPEIGSGLAGGSWDEIALIIKNALCYKKINCYVVRLS